MKIKSKDLALITVYAALYAALVIVLGGFSYGPIQIRIADSMVAAIPLLGFAGVLGHTLGVFTANIFSTAGPIDLLNTVPSFIMSIAVYYVYRKTKNDYTVVGTCSAYSIVLGLTVGWMLAYLLILPLFLTIVYVIIGNLIATVLIGWPLFKLLKRTGMFQKWFPDYSARDHRVAR
ncbi:MAG TPA: QueT transporter family protein [Candidatus Sulfotelmatobacter sp.]|nr:QueT transporter family protein [Candidatus Sulfotelmatobacter sp.]